jgi:hypothetical protein
VSRTGTLYAAVAEPPVEVATTDALGSAANHAPTQPGQIRAPVSVDELRAFLKQQAYLADPRARTSIWLASV